ncbi:hypothetical protein H0H81_009610 [Sphagnurus paluster]|uniref:RBR-type E3 ubiquitin transferase n=1 Tax=Sphagnurus paluster TaxID=117069 RepID=A0A9P7FXD6_9AGAR|nr:hypothetical protein H0H81_009610 [Sphagnurus paluster]
MADSSIAVGRMVVDRDHADLTRSLLDVQHTLADFGSSRYQSKGKGRAAPTEDVELLSDEEYAIKAQEQILQDALRVIEDFRFAKSLSQEKVRSVSLFDEKSLDHLLLLKKLEDECAAEQENGDPTLDPMDDIDDIYADSDPGYPDTGHNSADTDDEDLVVGEYYTYFKQAAAEHRQVLMNISVDAGLPGPSNVLGSGSKTKTLDARLALLEEEYDSDSDSVLDEPMPSPPTPDRDLREVFGEQFGFPTVYCLPCGDLIVGEPTLNAPCGHDYCVDCVQDIVSNATKDESSFPPRCCQKALSPEAFAPFLTRKIQAEYDSKRLEFSTPAPKRIFCPTSTCSAFLGSSQGAGKTLTCTKCAVVVCTACKLHEHPGETCSENTFTAGVKKLAKEKRWQTCPDCHELVEKTVGCNHIVCRCKANFCYGCGKKMGQCKCR